MAKNELTVIVAGFEITNKELARIEKKMQDNTSKGNSLRWENAGLLRDVVEDELFEDDFESMAQYAEAHGMTKATLCEMVKAVAYADETGLDKGLWTIGKAYSLSKIKDVEGFLLFIQGKGFNTKEELASMSDKFVKELVVEFNKTGKPAIEDKAGETVENAEAGETVEDVEDIAIIEWNGKQFNIPVSVLMKYEIK